MSLEIKRRTTTVLLFQGDDLDPIRDHADAVEKAVRSSGPARMGDELDPVISGTTQAFDEFLEAASERAVKVTLTAVGRRQYRDLLNAHPPRIQTNEDGANVAHPDDAGIGFNRQTFGDDLVPACMVDQGAPDEVAAFLDELSDGDFSKLYSAAVTLNQSAGPDPKTRLSSLVAPTSDETSDSPARLA